MALVTGARLGTYEITGALGAGGMGEVYRARDTKLDRDVAIKILPESVSADPDRLMRFEREARTLAALNHPNIATIFGIEDRALVMELVDGEDLSAQIARGPMPVAEALPIAVQIAAALEAAHEAGIVHRDLKPANVKVRDDGTVKVLDFGLAKALTPDRTGDGVPAPTMTSPALTAMGVVLGTAAYMAPEQARGKAVDRRADVWAFGVVLYEMLTGRHPFPGDEMSDVLAAVLRQPVDWETLPAGTPASVRRLLRRCLEKDRAERLGDMSAARLEIREALAGGAEASGDPAATDTQRRHAVLWIRVSAGLGLVSIALAGALAMSLAARSGSYPGAETIARFALVDDPNLRVNTWSTQPFAVSPDGRAVVFSADAGTGVSLWVRTLDQPEPRALADTEGAYQPAISPDGQWVAYVVANHVIRKARLGGGGATTIASIDDVTAALAWASNDQILFEKIGSGSGIHQVSANGGSPALLIPLDAAARERGHRRPLVLRDERLVLYASTTADGRTSLAAFSLADGRRGRLDVDGIQALGLVAGHLLYSRSDGALLAVPFDARGIHVTGPPRQLADRVSTSPYGTAVALSANGTLVASPPVSPTSRLMVGDAAGGAVAVGDSVRAFDSPRFSRDGRLIAIGITEGENEDLWILNRESAAATRVTRGGRGRITLQDWTPDGKALVYIRDSQLWVAPVDASAEPRRLLEIDGRITGASLLPDGRSIVIARRSDSVQGAVDSEDLVRIPLEKGGDEVSVFTSRSTGGTMRPAEPRVSPDGRWVAFLDRNERQVHVRSIDGTSGVQVSDAGGHLPVWVGDRSRLLYQTSGGPMVAELQTSPTLAVIGRRRGQAFPPGSSVHDVSADGKAFLVLASVDPGPGVVVTVNYAADVRRQLRTRNP